jgi:hypothetical protein
MKISKDAVLNKSQALSLYQPELRQPQMGLLNAISPKQAAITTTASAFIAAVSERVQGGSSRLNLPTKAQFIKKWNPLTCKKQNGRDVVSLPLSLFG